MVSFNFKGLWFEHIVECNDLMQMNEMLLYLWNEFHKLAQYNFRIQSIRERECET